jgi:D-threonate/D-erythronate kinase
MRSFTTNVLVLADDFTGANDAGVSLAEAGATVEVVFAAPDATGAQVLIVNSDSRALAPDEAARRIASLLHCAQNTFHPDWNVKKIDSTLRGNIGAEIDAMMNATGMSLAILAPAYPAVGRITRRGQCLVNGVPVAETEFATDPKTPVVTSDLTALVHLQSEIPCTLLTASELTDWLASHTVAAHSHHLLVVDAETDSDLDAVVRAVSGYRLRPLLIGSGGLCDALVRNLRTPVTGNLLAVVGSMSEIAQKQIARLADHPGMVRLVITPQDAIRGDIHDVARQAIAALQNNHHCIIQTSVDADSREYVGVLCADLNMTRAELGARICTFLGALTREITQGQVPGGLYLSGGDVAIAVARAHGATGFRIQGRLAECVPWGHFTGCDLPCRVMTKAGGFGDETTLLNILHFIEEKLSD